MALDISRFLNRFVDEAQDLLHQLADGIKQLEQGQRDADLVNGLFRAVHTMKGSSRMLNLLPIADTAHSLEELLSALREQRLTVNQDILDALYQAADWLADAVEHLAVNKEPASLPEKPAELCSRLLRLAENRVAEDESGPPPEAEAVLETTKQQAGFNSPDTVRLRLDSLSRLSKLISEVTASHAGLRELVRDAAQLRKDWDADKDSPRHRQAFERLFKHLKEVEGSQESLIYSLHDHALNLRMLPLSQVFEPAARHVREVGRMLGKRITSHVSGEDIELDRHIIEQLSEPLVHLLRNAIDHGIEEPATRHERGKPEVGQIRMSARQDAGWVVIELADDGAGLSLGGIRQKLLQQDLLSKEEVEAMSEQELTQQIFTPGLSTSSMITELSGRGVGLDVVRRKVVSDLQGLIEVRSQEGVGTTFTLRLPLSLAMSRVLLVEANGYMLGFSAQHVVELTRVAADRVLQVAERNVFVLRNEFVPIFEFGKLAALPQQQDGARPGERELLVLVLQVQHEKMALAIDDMLDERDLIINPVPAHLAHNTLVSGIVNHGYQQLISLIHVPHLLALARKRHQKTAEDGLKPGVRQHLLVVDDSLNTREIEKDVLEAWGYQVTLAEDGLDGLNKARNGDFDAVITDVEMPFMDGFTLTSHLREHERYKNRPIIIITSREKDSDRRRGIEVGADAYIVKGSFDQNNLVDTLRALLG